MRPAMTAPLLTVIVRGADSVVLPAASRATAVMMCVPSATTAVIQDVANGLDVSSAPTFTPSTLNCTPTTPTLSDAVAEIVTEPLTVAPSAGARSDTAGGTASGGLF